MIRLLKVSIGVARQYGIIAGYRAFRCGWWFGREARRRRRAMDTR